MTRKKIRGIIVLMSIALIGVISLQVYWILHDIRLKEQQFDQSVNQAMNAIVDRIETNEAMDVVNDHVFSLDPGKLTQLIIRDTSTTNPITITDTSIQFPELRMNDLPPVIEDLDNADINIEYHRPGSNQAFLRFQRRNYFNKDSISSHTIHRSQITRVYGDSAEVIIRQNEEKVKARLEKLNQVMEKMAIEFAGPEDDIHSRLDSARLDSLIHYELQNRGIGINVDYGVLKGTVDSFVLAKSSIPPPELKGSRYRTLLFPNDIVTKPDYLILHFPNTIRYLLASMWLMLVSSFIFTAIMLFVFTYTIQVIFRQKKLSDIKTDFINNMTHEFKTPIATISLAVDSIKDPRVRADENKMDYFTRIIREENKRMNLQVENVLQMAQLEKGELKLRIEEVNLHSTIQKAVELIALQVESKGGKIEQSLRAQLPVISGDSMHLSNVIFNLLDNANKYSPENPEISISTDNNSAGIIVRVTDKGIGMTKDTQKRIFEKFYRVPTGNIHNIKGFGLGLSYVKAIVEEHRGWISVESDYGKGSTFQIFLPFSTHR
ncbi:MAG: HAMP domain-containing sensor histidine kinase [Bacteroidia bacterium]